MIYRVGRYTIELVIQDWFRLDGGIIFSGVPRDIWSQFAIAQDLPRYGENTVKLPVNCFLITSPNGDKVLVDTSFGDADYSRWKDKIREFGMENGFNLLNGRRDSEQPNIVIPTHLHFDHAGGCAKLQGDELVPAFENARYIIHKDEIAHAMKAHPKTRSSYLRETIDGIKMLRDRGIISLISGSRFSTDECIEVFRTRGHTPGHLSIKIKSEGETALIMGALAPTRWHINILACGVGNDTHGLEAVDHKSKFLRRAAKEKWLLLLEHDEGVAGRAIELKKDKYEFVPAP